MAEGQMRDLVQKLNEAADVILYDERGADTPLTDGEIAELIDAAAELERLRAAPTYAQGVEDAAKALAASPIYNTRSEDIAVIRALRPPAAPAGSEDRCAKCGFPRHEHHHDGACYGLCGEFVPPLLSASAPAGAQERQCECFGNSGLHASTHGDAKGRTCCDLCGWPIRTGAVGVLTAVNSAPAGAQPSEVTEAIQTIEQFLDDADHFELADDSTVDIGPASAALNVLKAGKDEWQPIETAPKDGTRIYAWVPGIGADVMWRHDPGGEARNPKHHYECWVFASSQGPYPAKPTHWQYLPVTPTLADCARPDSTNQGKE